MNANRRQGAVTPPRPAIPAPATVGELGTEHYGGKITLAGLIPTRGELTADGTEVAGKLRIVRPLIGGAVHIVLNGWSGNLPGTYPCTWTPAAERRPPAKAARK